jgi:hypothetical protein
MSKIFRGKLQSLKAAPPFNPVWLGTEHFYPFVFVRSDFAS